MARYFASCRLLLLLGLLACLSGAAPPRESGTAEDGLTQLRSEDGVLDVTLTAQAGPQQVGTLELPGASYNGLYAGPVLRVRPGDLLRIHLINHLTQPTNLHFHGMRTSPLGNSDNIHIAVLPGASFTYEVRIALTQPPGLYWYHSHIHGVSEQQVMGGLSGALIVEGILPRGSPITERLLVLKEMTFDDDIGNPMVDDELHGVVQTINGRLDTNFFMRPGETQFWRLTNQSADRVTHIAIPGLQFRIVAEDGEAVVTPRDTDVLDILPAGRVEVLVRGGAAGDYPLLSKGVITGSGKKQTKDRMLGHVLVAGEPVPPAPFPPLAQESADLRGKPISARRVIVFTQTNTLKAAEQKFFVNGKVFDMARVDVRVPLGGVEEWTVRNDSDDTHIFHIHQLGFQIAEINGVAVPFNGQIDNVRVPERGYVKLLIPFTDPIIVGRFMFHCHVLKHEDKGMMGQVEVYEPGRRGMADRARLLYLHLWWWWHGVPWSLCGIADT